MSTTSNLTVVARLIDEVADSVDFTRKGVDRMLGRELLGLIAEGIAIRTIQRQVDPAGRALKPLSKGYRDWKRKNFGIEKIGILTGQMLSQRSLEGEQEVTKTTIQMTYGINEPALRPGSTMGAPKRSFKQSPTDTTPLTDRQKAEKFEVHREFYAMDDEIADAAVEHVGQYLDLFIATRS